MSGRGAAVACAGLFGWLTAAQAQVFDGYTVYNRIGSRTTYLVDNSGQTVRSWTSSNTGYISYLLPDSTVWRMEVYPGSLMRSGPYGGQMRRYDWSGNVVASFLWSDSNHQQHHDINVMPNGHVLLVAWARKSMAEGQALGRLNLTGEIWPDEVIEWDPDADSAVWQWSFWDHMIQDVDSTKPNYGAVREHPELLDINVGPVQNGDWMHCNTVDYNVDRDEVMVTSHTLGEVYVIDHSTTTAEAAGHVGGHQGRGGDFLYRWGNAQNYGRGTGADQILYVVHGANWVRRGLAGAGNILMLNNGDRPGTSGDSSAALEIAPPFDSGGGYHLGIDSAFGPRSASWSYSNGLAFYSQHLGGAYRLPNGNTLATLGVSGIVCEITPGHQVVWTHNAGGQIARAMKYDRELAAAVGDGSVAATNWSPGLVEPALARGSSICYTLSRPARVRLLVCDASGRLVESMVEERGPGSHGFRLGPRSAAGVYFGRLVVEPVGLPAEVESVKLLVTR
jgi:hypothetical protein